MGKQRPRKAQQPVRTKADRINGRKLAEDLVDRGLADPVILSDRPPLPLRRAEVRR
jgi:hypothetical protein